MRRSGGFCACSKSRADYKIIVEIVDRASPIVGQSGLVVRALYYGYLPLPLDSGVCMGFAANRRVSNGSSSVRISGGEFGGTPKYIKIRHENVI